MLVFNSIAFTQAKDISYRCLFGEYVSVFKHGIFDADVSGCYHLCPSGTERESDGGCLPKCVKPNTLIDHWDGKVMRKKCKRKYKIVDDKRHNNKDSCGANCFKEQGQWIKLCPVNMVRFGKLCLTKCPGKSSIYYCDMDKIYPKYLYKPAPVVHFKEHLCYNTLTFRSRYEFRGRYPRLSKIMFDVDDKGKMSFFPYCDKTKPVDIQRLRSYDYDINGYGHKITMILTVGKNAIDLWLSRD